jgi:hypothetical protein
MQPAEVQVITPQEVAQPYEVSPIEAVQGAGQVITPQEVSGPYRMFRMEAVQSALAYIFAAILLIIIVWSYWNTGGEDAVWTRTTELLDILLPVITSLLGSAVGFYFGQKVPGS